MTQIIIPPFSLSSSSATPNVSSSSFSNISNNLPISHIKQGGGGGGEEGISKSGNLQFGSSYIKDMLNKPDSPDRSESSSVDLSRKNKKQPGLNFSIYTEPSSAQPIQQRVKSERDNYDNIHPANKRMPHQNLPMTTAQNYRGPADNRAFPSHTGGGIVRPAHNVNVNLPVRGGFSNDGRVKHINTAMAERSGRYMNEASYGNLDNYNNDYNYRKTDNRVTEDLATFEDLNKHDYNRNRSGNPAYEQQMRDDAYRRPANLYGNEGNTTNSRYETYPIANSNINASGSNRIQFVNLSNTRHDLDINRPPSNVLPSYVQQERMNPLVSNYSVLEMHRNQQQKNPHRDGSSVNNSGTNSTMYGDGPQDRGDGNRRYGVSAVDNQYKVIDEDDDFRSRRYALNNAAVTSSNEPLQNLRGSSTSISMNHSNHHIPTARSSLIGGVDIEESTLRSNRSLGQQVDSFNNRSFGNQSDLSDHRPIGQVESFPYRSIGQQSESSTYRAIGQELELLDRRNFGQQQQLPQLSDTFNYRSSGHLEESLPLPQLTSVSRQNYSYPPYNATDESGSGSGSQYVTTNVDLGTSGNTYSGASGRRMPDEYQGAKDDNSMNKW